MNLYNIRQELLRGVSIYDMPLNVVFYARVSTSSDDQLHSLSNQIGFFKDFVKDKKQWNLIGHYVDEGITGTSANKRESFMNMIADGKNGKFDLILTKEVSRFARNTLDSIYFTRELLSHNVGVFFINDNINTIEPDSELRLTIMASMAQDESRKISSRVKFGYQRSIEKGVVLGNNKIWGYKKDDGKLAIVEEEAEMVRTIFNLYSEGNGYRKIGDALYNMGYANSNGNKFGSNTLKYIITNPKYKGYYCGNKNTKIDIFSNKRQEFEEDEWVVWKDEEGDTVPAIVDEVLWDKCNEMLKKKAAKFTDKKGRYSNRYSFSEKIICCQCDLIYWRAIYRYKSGDKELWQCKNYRKGGKKACDSPLIYTSELNKVLGRLRSNLKENPKIKNQINTLLKVVGNMSNDDSVEQTNRVNEQIDLLNRKKEKLLELSLEGIISNKEFKVRNDKLNEEILKQEQILSKYNERKDIFKKRKSNIKLFEKTVDELFDENNDSDEELSSEALKQLIDKIYIEEDKEYKGYGVKINLKVVFKIGAELLTSFIRKYNKVEIVD